MSGFYRAGYRGVLAGQDAGAAGGCDVSLGPGFCPELGGADYYLVSGPRRYGLAPHLGPNKWTRTLR